jgi:hypothetical protein
MGNSDSRPARPWDADGAGPFNGAEAPAAEEVTGEPDPVEPEPADPLFDRLASELGLGAMLQLTRVNFNVLERRAVEARMLSPDARPLQADDFAGQLDVLGRGAGTARRNLAWLGLGFKPPGTRLCPWGEPWGV